MLNNTNLKTVIAKIPAEDHAFLVENNLIINRLVPDLIKQFIIDEKYKVQLLIADRKKEETLYATYTKQEPVGQPEPADQFRDIEPAE